MGLKNGPSKAQTLLQAAVITVPTATAVLWQSVQKEKLSITGKMKF
jgi:hypothetical protein